MKIKDKDILVGFEVECIAACEDPSIEDLHISHVEDLHDDGSIGEYNDDEETPVEACTFPLAYRGKRFDNFFESLGKSVAGEYIRLNSTCGLHFHMSFLRDRHIALTQLSSGDLIREWQEMVKKEYPTLWFERYENSYCEVYDTQETARVRMTRYKAINVTAGAQHGTLECRFYGPGDRPFDVIEYKKFVIDTVEFFKKKLLLADFRRPIASAKVEGEKMQAKETITIQL